MMKAVLMIVLIIHLKRKVIIKRMIMMKKMMKKVKYRMIRTKLLRKILVLKEWMRKIISYNNRRRFNWQKVRRKVAKKVRRMNLQMKMKKAKNQNKV